MHSDSKAITSSKERKKFECHETTGSRSRPVTRAITFITNKTKKPLEDKCEKNKYFHSKSDCLGTTVSLTNQEGHYKQRSQRSRITKQVFVYYHVFEISGNSKCGQVPKRGKHKNFIPFYVLLSFLVCINAESKFQTGAALFKTAFKV